MKNQIEYKIGEIYLFDRFQSNADFEEVEILNVSKSASAIKVNRHGWITAKQFHEYQKGKIGQVVYKPGYLLFNSIKTIEYDQ